jgi:hypothetical protein
MDAILLSQHLANVFVDASRRSAHVTQSPEEELDMMIYNSKLYFTLKDSVMDPSCKFFDVFCQIFSVGF